MRRWRVAAAGALTLTAASLCAAPPSLGNPFVPTLADIRQIAQAEALHDTSVSDRALSQNYARVTPERGGPNPGSIVPNFIPVALRLEPLAGHMGFATLAEQARGRGFDLTTTNNILGVGMSATYDLRLMRHVALTPFAALNYNRVDNDHLINISSPRPFTTDNGDIGFTASTGLALRARVAAVPDLRTMIYGAMVAGSENGGNPREAASIATRIIQSLDNAGPERVWGEFGVGSDYHFTPTSAVRAAVVRTVGHPHAEALSAQIAWRTALR